VICPVSSGSSLHSNISVQPIILTSNYAASTMPLSTFVTSCWLPENCRPTLFLVCVGLEFSTPLGDLIHHNVRTTTPFSSPDIYHHDTGAHRRRHVDDVIVSAVFQMEYSPNSSQGVLLNIVIGITLMVHQPLKPPLRQTLEAYPVLTPP